MLTLYTYFRSSAAYRVRIALNLKGLDFKSVPVHLVRDGGEQHHPAYRDVNPAGLVPVLIDDDLQVTQSLAIIEYLEACHPQPRLLPGTPGEQALIRSLAMDVACDIHPLNNLRVLQHLGQAFGADDATKKAWVVHWITTGFAAFERRIEDSAGLCCVGDHPTLADIALVPQVFNAERFGVDLKPYPTIRRVAMHCRTLDAFAHAEPAAQADAE
ncbi:maleylacetoacetate isomerase [Aquabacterium sp.]|uniref:maleylacetoacetate isomerase n=1 Tax=Aquabacterium sp. TaxID=1872578 RepID=UPI003BAE2904